ncbi:hypothetical protein [Paenibacillus sp.]|uniref:hypothetical protein n=1 Tax=Paenibacillus sp. TaxID=58172 RepID=UPI0028A8E36A|nr:hypothetical protein [Paenibacillus sp.]
MANWEKRRIDFRYGPDVIQTCIGLVDDVHKTIVREDGSMNYNFNQNAHRTRNEMPQSLLMPTIERNLCFNHRYKPVFQHRDRLVRVDQTYGDPRAAIVTTTEKYE